MTFGILAIIMLITVAISFLNSIEADESDINTILKTYTPEPFTIDRIRTYSHIVFRKDCKGLEALHITTEENAEAEYQKVVQSLRNDGWKTKEKNYSDVRQFDISKEYINPLEPDISGWIRLEKGKEITVGFFGNYKSCY